MTVCIVKEKALGKLCRAAPQRTAPRREKDVSVTIVCAQPVHDSALTAVANLSKCALSMHLNAVICVSARACAHNAGDTRK